jgi:serine protease inhibitor
MTATLTQLAERKSFMGALIASALAVFVCFALAIATPSCAYFKSTLGPALASCGTTTGLTAASQFDTIVADALTSSNFQAALTALENDGEAAAVTGVLCAVQKVAFSSATLAVAPNGVVASAITPAVFVSPKYSTVQVANARAYLSAHK